MMQTRTLTISPGGSEELKFAQPTEVTFLMSSDDDVVWLMLKEGALDVDTAVRLDKAQCPLRQTWTGLLAIHSPVQGERTVQVSLILGGAA
jgi:hypothetical protein